LRNNKGKWAWMPFMRMLDTALKDQGKDGYGLMEIEVREATDPGIGTNGADAFI